MTVALVVGLLLGTSSGWAQQNMGRPIAGCIVAARDQQSRVMPGNEFYRNMEEFADYWQEQLARIEPDASKRAVLLSGAKAALDGDNANAPRTEGLFRNAQILDLCRKQREKVEHGG